MIIAAIKINNILLADILSSIFVTCENIQSKANHNFPTIPTIPTIFLAKDEEKEIQND